MAKHLRNQKLRLAQRQQLFATQSPGDTRGRKQPGSMNPHKSMSIKLLRKKK